MLRLAIVRPSAHVIGPEDYNLQEAGLAGALLDFMVDTDIYMAGNVKRPLAETVLEKDGFRVRLIRLPFGRLPGRQGVMPSLFGFLKEGRYDLIQVQEYGQIMSYAVALYGKKRGTPVVLCQGMYEDYKGVFPRTAQIFFEALFLKAMRGNVSSAMAKTSLAAKYLGMKGFKDVVVCPVALDSGKFEDAAEKDWRDALGIPAGSKIMLYVGVMEPRRNVDFLIGLAGEVSKKLPGSRLLIAGEGPEGERLKRKAAGLVPEGCVHFLGKVPQRMLPSLYKSADVFLMPSGYEIFGMAILEAMHFGLPVLTTPTAGAMETVVDGESGIILKGLETEDWLDAVMGLFSNPELFADMGRNAARRAGEFFTWGYASRGFLKAYVEAVRKKTGKGPVSEHTGSAMRL